MVLWGGRDVDHLVEKGLEFFELAGPVVLRAEGSRKPWSTSVSFRLRSPLNIAADLRDGDVALVDDEQPVVGKKSISVGGGWPA